MNKVYLNKINICLSCDENYAQYAGVVIASILANSKADEDVFIYILDGNISETSKNKILSLKSIKDCSIEFVKVNEKDFEDYKKIPNHDYISISTYYRLKVIVVGAGKEAPKYIQDLLNKGCKFINLVNKTSIYELAQVIRNCKALVSVDTGTMHFGYANSIPTVCIFYEKENIKCWAPDKKLYPNVEILTPIHSSDEIIKSLLDLMNKITQRKKYF